MVYQKSIRIRAVVFRIIYAVSVILLFSSCESPPLKPGPPYNPLDLNNPNYLPPQVYMSSGPDSNGIAFSDTVTFAWDGNLLNMQFSYQLNESGFSSFAEVFTVTYSGLAFGDHLFEIQGGYVNGEKGQIKKIPFKVDVVRGPALIFEPDTIELTSSNKQFEIALWAVETDPIAGFSAKLFYDPQQIQIDLVDIFDDDQESFLLQNGGTLISFSENDTINGVISIDCAVATGKPRDVSGSGKIARISATLIGGTSTSITISDESLFRNSSNADVAIINLRHAQIYLQ